MRLLVFESEKGEVWTAYTDFGWIARRHGIKNRLSAVQDGFRSDRIDHIERDQEIASIAMGYQIGSHSAFPFAH